MHLLNDLPASIKVLDKDGKHSGLSVSVRDGDITYETLSLVTYKIAVLS